MKKDFFEKFKSPDASWRGKPFWSWNGELRKEELIRQVEVMKEMGLGGYFMHSRAGLITEYLGDDWFDMINAVADAGEKLGMESWLYDEDRWPSGSAGGKVTVEEQYRAKSLRLEQSAPESFKGRKIETVAVFVAKIDGINVYSYYEVTPDKSVDEVINDIADACALGQWQVLHFYIKPDPCNSNYNGTTYIDTMSYKAVRKFIDMTHEEYKRRCGKRIGTTIKGIFTDEPHRGHCFDNLHTEGDLTVCDTCWTDDLFEEFKKRYGYDPLPILPELFFRPEGRKVAPVKLHYIDLANNLFIERFAMPINQWCKDNGIEFTGHVLHEDSLMNQTVPHGSLMRFYEHMGYPGVDVLTENNRCYWIVKQLSSVARQLDKKWLLSELYGCTGWQFNFKSHKAVGDWQALFGINVRCQHLSWYTMEGESKRDYPASILHQSPWYKDYSAVEDHFARMGMIISSGKPDCDLLVINPIESVWAQAYIGWSKWIFNASSDIEPYEKRYAQLFHMLTDNHIDFDYGEEQMMRDHWSISVDKDQKVVLNVGNASYRAVLVTNMLTIRSSTVDILKKFREAGGEIIFAGDVPQYVDAIISSEPQTLASKCIVTDFDEAKIVSLVRSVSDCFTDVTSENGTEKAVFVQVRRNIDLEGSDAAVVLNTDRSSSRKNLTLHVASLENAFVEEWDLERSERYAVEHKYENGVISINFDLDAAGTRCFVLSKTQDPSLKLQPRYTLKEELEITNAEFEPIFDEPNVCVLDFCRYRFSGQYWSDYNEALKIDQQVRNAVGIELRGGEMLQPWYAKLNYTQKYGELELEYDFFIDRIPSSEVFLAGERPEFNSYFINGTPLVSTDINDFWIDDCFKKMHVPKDALVLGKNTVTVKVDFMRTTNIEALYLVGDFGVSVSETNKRTLVEPAKKLMLGNFADLNMPFYTGSATYRITPEMYEGLNLSDGERVLLSCSFTGGCFKVITQNGLKQVCAWDPYLADVTEAVKNKESIDLCVVGTRKNLFGPLHMLPAVTEACGPGHFITSGDSWTDGYSLIDSGAHRIIFKVMK